MTTENHLINLAEKQLSIKETAYNEGFNTGKKSKVSWDSFQALGSRTNYDRGFAYWNIEEISPEYKITPTGICTKLFYDCQNLKYIDKDKFDLSQAKYSPTDELTSPTANICWRCYNLEVFPDIGLQAGCYKMSFAGNLKLHTIEKLRVTEESIFSITTFVGCSQLQNVDDIEGTFGQDLFLQPLINLHPESLKRFIKHLKDYYDTDYSFTKYIYIHKTTLDALEAEGWNDEDKAWYKSIVGISWFEGMTWEKMIEELCWILTIATN